MNDWTLYLACKRLIEYHNEEKQILNEGVAKKLCFTQIDLNEILTINIIKQQ